MSAKVDSYWAEKLNELAAAEPRAGAPTLHRRLVDAAAASDRTDYPSLRWVGKHLIAFRALSSKVQAGYASFTWPDTMENGLLPWEASRIGLDLWKSYKQVGADPPTVNRVRWNWRLSFAVPDMEPIQRDLEVTSILFADDQTFERLERRLAFEPWRDAEHLSAYNGAFPNDRWEE